jgi:hypothetical protein
MHAEAAEPDRPKLHIAGATAMVLSGLASFGHTSPFITFQGLTFRTALDPQERSRIADSTTSMPAGMFAQKGDR